MNQKTQLKITQKILGVSIAETRKQRNLTQKNFAQLLGTSQSAIARIEKGEQNLSTEMVLKISGILGKNIISLSNGTQGYRVSGGKKLSGEITVNTSKNGVIGLLFASLLNHGATILKEIPRIEEVYNIVEILSDIGISFSWRNRALRIKMSRKIDVSQLNDARLHNTRSAMLLIGSLASHVSSFTLPYPVGRYLSGYIDWSTIYTLEQFGITITPSSQGYNITYTQNNTPCEIVMYESSDVVTENALLVAAGRASTTTIVGASANYMVQELCLFLQQLGVHIDGIGTSTLIVYGQPSIKKDITYTLSEDPIEAMLLLSASIITQSTVTILRCPINFLKRELLRLRAMGVAYKTHKEYCAKNNVTKLVDITVHPSKLTALPGKIEPLPYPGINIDNVPFFAPLATQAHGRMLIHDWVYDQRTQHYAELNKLGANVILADPHRAFITGPTTLHAADIICPPSLRPAAMLLIAMLAADGVSTLRNIYTINRGYEDICPRLNSIGAHIETIHDFT